MHSATPPVTADLRAALDRANSEAARRHNVYVDVEHLLLGLLGQGGGPARDLLCARGADASALYARVAGTVGVERETPVALKGYSRGARDALDRAAREAAQLGQPALDSRHLLLALLLEQNGGLGEMLGGVALNADDVRDDLHRQPPVRPVSGAAPGAASPSAAEPEVVVIPTRRGQQKRDQAAPRRDKRPWLIGGLALLLVYLIFVLPGGSLFTFVFVLVGWVFSVTLHEFAHAVVAYWGGDHTVKDKGYLSFNPLKYTHPMLSLGLPLLFLAMGGIGLPGGAVYIERHRLRSKWWSAGVSAAGPLANLLLALLLALPFIVGLVDTTAIEFRLWLGGGPQSGSIWENSALWSAIAFLIMLQITAVCFNLLPVPPLDGFGVIEPLLDARTRWQLLQVGSYGLLIVFLALWFIPPVAQAFWAMIFDITHLLQIPNELVREGFRSFMFWRNPP
jgi:Zn-dependent protease